MHIPAQGGHSPQLPSRRPLHSHSPLDTKLSIPTPHSNPPPLGGAPPTAKNISPSSSPRGHRRVSTFVFNMSFHSHMLSLYHHIITWHCIDLTW